MDIFLLLLTFVLVGPALAMITKTHLVRRILVRSQRTRRVGLILLAAFSYSIGLVSLSYIGAEVFYFGNAWRYEDNCSTCDSFGFYPLEWERQKKPAIVRELVAEILMQPLSAETCFATDPQVCEFASRPSSVVLSLPPLEDYVFLKA